MVSIEFSITQEDFIRLMNHSIQLELIRSFLKKKREEDKTYLDIEDIERFLMKAE